MAAAALRGFCSLVILVFTSTQSSFERQVKVQLNPGLTPPPPDGDLLHMRAFGQNDTLHYLFCSLGAPTLLLIHTNSSSSTIQVDWPQFLGHNGSGSLRVEPESSILYSTAVIFSRLLEYDDANDTAGATSYLFPPYELQNFTWAHLNLTDATARLCGTISNVSSGMLCLQLSVFKSDGRGSTWPRLIHTANSSQLEVWLDGVSPRAARSRFQLELQAVGGAYPLSRVEVHRSIDDEYTPSIFKASRWVSVANGSSEVQSFVQWKAVAYHRPDPALEDAMPCSHSEPQPQSAETVASSNLIKAFYSEPETSGLNVSFGLAGDPFYNSTRFLSWTVLVGVGSPPVDSFSPLVVTIMAVGLGTPVILLLLGGLWVCVRKKAADPTAYERIN